MYIPDIWIEAGTQKEQYDIAGDDIDDDSDNDTDCDNHDDDDDDDDGDDMMIIITIIKKTCYVKSPW